MSLDDFNNSFAVCVEFKTQIKAVVVSNITDFTILADFIIKCGFKSKDYISSYLY